MYRHVCKNPIVIPSRNFHISSNRSISLLLKNNSSVNQLSKSPRLLSVSLDDSNIMNNNYLALLSTTQTRHFQIQSSPNRKDAESIVEKASNILKTDKTVQSTATKTEIDVPRPSLWDKIVKESKHYYNGFKLLFLESRIAFRLLRHVLQGNTLTRRERRQFTRTVADLFRLVPFSLFIIIPFMELTLPIFLKLFPNMLPSTFSEASREREKMKKQLKAKLEMAKFLQDTLEETALKSSSKGENSLSINFSKFMKNVRTNEQQPTNEEIMKYSALFENELTLDNLTRPQLIALCQILDVSTLGNIPPDHILRFQLRMKMRTLEADDKTIIKEGIDKLDIAELQQACRDRGMRAMGLSKDRLILQLEQWLDLHIKQNIPISLLLFSRSLYLPENLPKEEVIKSTLSKLPQSIEDITRASIAEISGKMDNTTRLQLLKQEEQEIQKENIEHDAEIKKDEKKTTVEKSPVLEMVYEVPPEMMKSTESSIKPEAFKPVETLDLSKTPKSEFITDKAKVYDTAKLDTQDLLTPMDIKEISQIIDTLPQNEKKIISEELNELKKDVDEYKEDVKEVEELSSAEKLSESKSAKILSKQVAKLMNDMDKLMVDLDKTSAPASRSNMVSIDELMTGIKQLRGESDDPQTKKLLDVLKSLDSDNDGKIDDLNDVIKVFDMIEQENVKVTKAQLSKLIKLMEKEKFIEHDKEELIKLQQKQETPQDSKN